MDMPIHNRTRQVRLTLEQKKAVLNVMRSDGHRELSTWARERLLRDSLPTERMIKEIHAALVGDIEHARSESCFKARILPRAS